MKVVDNTTYFSVVSSQAIPTGKKIHKFSIKILISQAQNIMVGIGSKALKGVANAYMKEDFAGLYAYGKGFVWEKGNQRELGLIK